MASIEELRRKGPQSRREISKWGNIGIGALSLGCIGAAATGQIYLGLPCVVGGALASGGLKYYEFAAAVAPGADHRSDHRASGSGRSWNFTTFGRSRSPSMCQVARPA